MPDTRSPIASLGAKVVATLSAWAKDIAQWTIDILMWPFVQITEAISEYLFDKLQIGSVPGQRALLNLGADQSLLEYLSTDIAKASGVGRLIVALMVAAGTIMGFIKVSLDVGSRRMVYYINGLLRNRYISADEAVLAYIRGTISGSEMINLGEMDGFGASQMEVKQSLMTQIPPPDILDEMSRRDMISREEAVRQATYSGYSPKYASLLIDLGEIIPPIPDLVAMADRLSWDESYAAIAGTDADRSPEVTRWAAKHGLSEYWVNLYWRTHWQPIDLGLGFEMLHRGFMDVGELKTMLKAQHIPPGLQERYIKVAYNPYTRVDIRRMYKLGILNLGEVKKAYMDIGYDSEHATKLTQFTASLNIQADAELTKADVLDGYGRRLLDQEEAIRYLIMMGFDSTSIGFYLARVDMNVEADKKKQVITNIKARFEKGIIEENEARQRLAGINVPDTEINELIATWYGTRGQAVFTPTLADLKSFFKAEIITETVFRDEMTKMGCSKLYQDWYIAAMVKGSVTT